MTSVAVNDSSDSSWSPNLFGSGSVSHPSLPLGKAGVSGSAPDLFDQPTDVLVAPNGDIFVSDSHRNGKNNRIVRFTKDGTFIKRWGKKGSGRGEMSEPHTIAMDSRGRLFVGDRENNRIASARDGKVSAFIEDSESTAPDHAGAEALGVDARGNVYGAVVRRQMLERHVKK